MFLGFRVYIRGSGFIGFRAYRAYRLYGVWGSSSVQVRIAHGSKAKQCPIHHLFRVIVITEISAPAQVFMELRLSHRSLCVRSVFLCITVSVVWDSLSACLGFQGPLKLQAHSGSGPFASSAASGAGLCVAIFRVLCGCLL